MSHNSLRQRNSPLGNEPQSANGTNGSPVRQSQSPSKNMPAKQSDKAGTPSKKKKAPKTPDNNHSKQPKTPRTPSVSPNKKRSLTKVSDGNASVKKRFSSVKGKAGGTETQPLLRPVPRSYSDDNVSGVCSLYNLSKEEETFLRLVEDGDVFALDQYLKGASYVNVNCVNIYGYTALTIAAKSENFHMVKFLMDRHDVIVGTATLYAVRTGNKKILEYMLDHRPVRKKSSESIALARTKMDERESPDFCSDIDPLILACHLDRYEMVDMMVKRGHVIERPHPPNCNCKERCHTRKAGQSLSFSLTRYHLYKAFASPSYVMITSSDPILTTFKLSKELKKCASNEREFKVLYGALSEQCDKFSLALLAECRTSDEVQLIVHKRDPDDAQGAGGKKKCNFARIKLAFDYDQRMFIAHQNTQQVLRSSWLKGFRSWRTMSNLAKIVIILLRTIFLPFFIVLHWLSPCLDCDVPVLGWNKGPLYKFLNFVASYVIFLVVICLQMYMSAADRKRGAPHTGLEIFILMYVTGYIWNNFKVMYNNGYKWFFSYKWHIFDVVSLLLFYGSFIAWSWAEIQVMQDGNRYLPRHLWSAYDPTLFAESLYAWATVCAILKIMYFLQIDSNLGPMQISLSRTVREVITFIFLFLVFFVAFCMGLFMIYEPYTGQEKTEDGEVIKQIDAFNTFDEAAQTLYWALYGYSPPVFADIVVSDNVIKQNGTVVERKPNHHRPTELFGQTMYGIYNVIAIIILLNLLIGLLGNTFSEVKAMDDVEWKFARTQIYMRFFTKDSATIPPPFNLVPSFKSFMKVFVWLCACCRGEGSCSLKRGLYVKEKDDEDDEEAYQKLMRTLTMRYLIGKDFESNQNSITMADLGSLKNELVDLVYRQIHSPDTPRRAGNHMPVHGGDPGQQVLHDATPYHHQPMQVNFSPAQGPYRQPQPQQQQQMFPSPSMQQAPVQQLFSPPQQQQQGFVPPTHMSPQSSQVPQQQMFSPQQSTHNQVFAPQPSPQNQMYYSP